MNPPAVLSASAYNQAETGRPDATRYSHDARGRLASINQYLGEHVGPAAPSVQPERTESFTYDAQTGRIASATKREGAIDYAYDDHGALASMSFLGRTVAYGYDAHERLSHVQAPDGEWRYEYDSSGRKKSVENVAAGLLETWDHDELGRLRSITHFDTAKWPEDEGYVIYEAEYTFGPDGRRVAMVERRSSNEASETLWQYEYDGLGRLVAEMAGTRDRDSAAVPEWSREVEYAYDVDSNRVSEKRLHADPVEEDSYVIDTGSQRLLSIVHLEGGVHARTTLFQYGAAGELTSKQVRRASDNGLLSAEDYTWTPKGEMESALVDHDGDGDDVVAVLYGYDDRGTLVERTSYLVDDGPASAVTERYLVDYENPTGYSQVVAEWRQVGSDADFVLARLYSYGDDLRAETTLVAAGGSSGAGGGGPPAHALVPGVQFPLRDALGTVRASAGFGSGLTPGEASINDYRYSAFGLPLGENLAPADASTRGSLTSQSAPSPWAFTGQRIDPATGLQYHRARWLDTALGRWASVDPVWDWPGNAGSSSSYPVCSVNNTSDPSGKFSLIETKIVAAISKTIAAIGVGNLSSYVVGSFVGNRNVDNEGLFFESQSYSTLKVGPLVFSVGVFTVLGKGSQGVTILTGPFFSLGFDIVSLYLAVLWYLGGAWVWEAGSARIPDSPLLQRLAYVASLVPFAERIHWMFTGVSAGLPQLVEKLATPLSKGVQGFAALFPTMIGNAQILSTSPNVLKAIVGRILLWDLQRAERLMSPSQRIPELTIGARVAVHSGNSRDLYMEALTVMGEFSHGSTSLRRVPVAPGVAVGVTAAFDITLPFPRFSGTVGGVADVSLSFGSGLKADAFASGHLQSAQFFSLAPSLEISKRLAR